MRISVDNFRWLKPLIVLLILSHLIGCSKHQLLKKPIEQSISEVQPKWILVTLHNGKKYQIHRPFVSSDTLYGEIKLSYFTTRLDLVGFSLNDIAEVRERKTDWVLTTVLIVGITITGLLIAGYFALGAYIESGGHL